MPTKKAATKTAKKVAAKSATKTAAKKAPAKKAAAKKSAVKKVTARKAAPVEIEEDLEPAPAGGTSLVIVESPAKAKTIGKYLGRGYTVRATVGHVRDLPAKKLGIDIDHGFAPEYVTIEGKEDILTDLKKIAKGAREIFIATDPDREGEAIGWHVEQYFTQPKRHAVSAPIRRVMFHEITKDAVHKSMAKPMDIDNKKVEAQQARRVLDRLVGYKASPVLWKTVKKGLSAGRVQTVALRLIVEREREIRAFTPVEYWSIAADLQKGQQPFSAKLHHVDGKKPEISTGAEADAILADLKGRKEFEVTEVKRRERRKNPAAPFTTSTLQQEAAKKLGYGSKRTMRLAQDLYEGIDVGIDGATGLITYMRTDSTRVSEDAANTAREALRTQFGEDYLSLQPQLYPSGKANAQDAHEGVRPHRSPLVGRSRCRSTSPPISSSSISSSGSASWRRRCRRPCSIPPRSTSTSPPRAVSVCSAPPAPSSSSRASSRSIAKPAKRATPRRSKTSRRSRSSRWARRCRSRPLRPPSTSPSRRRVSPKRRS
ncbi:MAG: type I DNA topoisomerase [Gemmatimonas sp.]